MKVKIRLFSAVVLVGLSSSAYAQAPPPGSYQQSCRDIRMQGSTLSAVCRRANGRGDQLTALDVRHCAGDIGNNNGQLACNGGQPVAPPAATAETRYGASILGTWIFAAARIPPPRDIRPRRRATAKGRPMGGAVRETTARGAGDPRQAGLHPLRPLPRAAAIPPRPSPHGAGTVLAPLICSPARGVLAPVER